MSKTKQDYEVLMTEEGFWFGRLLKNGTMSADSVRIDDDQITNMLAAWFERHCAREQTDELWITKPDGAILVKQFTSEQIQEAATKAAKAADKRGQTGARSQSAERKQARPQVKAADKRGQSGARTDSAERKQARPQAKKPAKQARPQAKKPAAKSRKKGA